MSCSEADVVIETIACVCATAVSATTACSDSITNLEDSVLRRSSDTLRMNGIESWGLMAVCAAQLFVAKNSHSAHHLGVMPPDPRMLEQGFRCRTMAGTFGETLLEEVREVVRDVWRERGSIVFDDPEQHFGISSRAHREASALLTAHAVADVPVGRLASQELDDGAAE